jgi:hypothetical protein
MASSKANPCDALLTYSSNFENDRVVCVWTSVGYNIFVFAPWKFNAITHGVDFGK